MSTSMTRLILIPILLLILSSCGGGSSDSNNNDDPPAPPPPTNAVSLAADPVEVGRGAPSLITASVGEDVEGAKHNRSVSFEIKINASGGEIESADQQTDEQGRARAIYRAGSGGGTDVLRAIIPPYGDSTVNIKVFQVDPVRQSLKISADPNKVDMDGVSKITATLTDKDGPVPGVVGTFSFVSNPSGARLAATDRSTGPDGTIIANYRAGNRPGVDIVQASFGSSISATVSITVDNPTATITVSPTSLPAAEQFVPYSSLLTASGGRPDYSFSVATGSAMPPGVTLGANGVVTGNAGTMRPGTYSFVVQVQDSAGRVKLQTINLTVNEPSSDLDITTSQLNEITISVPYSDRLEASGGRQPYVWSVATGSSLPAWLTLTANGIINGTAPAATTPGEVSFIAQVLDANGSIRTKRITVDVKTP